MSRSRAVELTGDRKGVYRFVERNGPVSPSSIADALDIDSHELGAQLLALQRDAMVDVDEGSATVETRLDTGDAEEHRDDGVSYTIRPARQADRPQLISLVRAVASETAYVTAERFVDRLEYEQTIFRRTPTDVRAVFVATVAGDVAGWVHLDGREDGGLSGAVELTVGVDSDHRNAGIGSHLLYRGVGWACARGCHKAYNSLPATSRGAIAFLEANDWQAEAVRPDHYEVDGELVDEIMLARPLGENC